jgi:hypothetical protein
MNARCAVARREGREAIECVALCVDILDAELGMRASRWS